MAVATLTTALKRAADVLKIPATWLAHAVRVEPATGRATDFRVPYQRSGLVAPPGRVRCATHHRRVPTISRFYGIVIAMFFDDHGYPHFHARHAEGEAKVRIDNLEVIDSTLPRRQLRFVLAWAELHQEELTENWRRARAGETLKEIEPLR